MTKRLRKKPRARRAPKGQATEPGIWPYLRGWRNIWGSGLGLIALGLHFAGVIEDRWLLAIAAAYLAGFLIGGRIRGTPYDDEPAQPDSDTLRDELNGLMDVAYHKLPSAMFARVVAVKKIVVALLPLMEKQGALDPNVYVIRQTAASYLPRLVETYLRLPINYAQSHRLNNGETPAEVFLNQLELLETELKQIEVKLHENDSRALLAHGRFLEQKFGQNSFDWLG